MWQEVLSVYIHIPPPTPGPRFPGCRFSSFQAWLISESHIFYSQDVKIYNEDMLFSLKIAYIHIFFAFVVDFPSWLVGGVDYEAKESTTKGGENGEGLEKWDLTI